MIIAKKSTGFKFFLMKLQKNMFCCKFIFMICFITSLSLLVIYYNAYLIYNQYPDNSMTNMFFYEKGPGFINMKYVLKYGPSSRSPFTYIPEGQDIFVKRNCSVKNCFITSDINFLSSITAFHVILFNGPHIIHRLPSHCLPSERSPNQSYIFVNTESSDNYYVPDIRYNGVFNFTWTYKLSSDIYYGYVSIRNKNGEVIGPKENIPWISIDDMIPINESVKEKLKYKKFAAAWFVSNCHAHNRREKWVFRIDEELRKYNMSVDIYGNCLYKKCPHKTLKCSQMIQRDYYFYFAFENSMSDDYVTEKLLRALNNYAVPVVFGGADYKRFMPDGIYLNVREMNTKDLVKQMVEIINDENRYHSFFKWHNHYSYHSPEESADTDSFCELCDFINKIKPNSNTYINDFFEWWNPHVIVPKTENLKK